MVRNVVDHNEAEEKSENEAANTRKVVHVGKETDEEERHNDQTEILEQFEEGISQQTPMVEDEYYEEGDDTKLPSCRSNLQVRNEQNLGIHIRTRRIYLLYHGKFKD